MGNRPTPQIRIQEKLAITNKALESTSDAINIADATGVSVYHNPAFLNLFGFSVNEVNVGGIPSMLFTDTVIGESIFRHVRESGSWRGEVELRSRSGRVIPTSLRVDSIHDEDEQLIGFISVITDISDRKRVEQMQHEHRALAEALRDTATALTKTLDFDEVVQRILNNLSLVVPHDAANFILLNPDGTVHLVDGEDYQGKLQMVRLKSGKAHVSEYADLRHILKTGMPLVVSSTRDYLATHPEMASHTPWLNSHIGSPIMLQSETIGFLNVDSLRADAFSEKHAHWLQIFVEQAAVAIQNAQLHQKAQQLAIIEERRRLTRNLHDAVSQTLFSASMIAEALPRLWDRSPDDVLAHIEQLRLLARGALAEMRALVFELHPERLYETSLKQLLQQLVNGMLGQLVINVNLQIEETKALPSDVHVAFYHIVQEALNNIVKHAAAANVTITLHQSGETVMLQISDDGQGFDPEDTGSASFGLNIMRERAQAVEAELNIESVMGQGTTILVMWSG